MAELLLLPVVRGVVSKAASALIQTVTHMCGVDGDRCKLERQLLAVQCKLTDAEVKSETNQYVKRWMMDFRTVAYEADDVLDDFQYEALRSQAKIGVSKTHKVLIHFTSDSPLLFRLTMSRKLRNVLEKINELVKEMNTFGLLNSVEQPQIPCRQTHAALSEYAEIFGRDADRELVVKLLLDQQNNQKVQVLPIFGMGGLGKTTLAKMVYNDHRVQQHFQLNMWHCVSENFEAYSLVKSVIELATKGACNLPETIELLRVRLQEVIGKKRYLLVLDDVWNEEDRKWEDELKPLLCSVGGLGSVIVVTCRSKRVASIMGTLGPHKLSCLSDDDSWELFSKKAFSNCVEEQTELVTIGRCIAQKCRGLPLALKIMGGLMSSKQQLHEWETIEESNIGDSVQGKDEIMSILKVSYKHLSSEMKQCFAFCALFPKGYEMEKDLLIQLWMANGFIQDDDTTKLTQKGESIFYDLVCRSFFQELKIKKWYCIGNDTSYEAIGCKMHDLMHDLAKHVTDECATVEELIQKKGLVKHVHMGSLTTLCNSLHMEGEGYSTPVQIFPKLKEMTLHKLPNLEVWVETSLTDPNRLVLFPVLELLKMKDCPKLASIPDSPVLKDLNITNCCSLPVSSLTHLTALCDLQCDGEGTMSTNMPLGFWPCLVSLTVWSLANMMMLPPEDQQTRKNAETLRILKLCGPNCFITTVGLSKSQLRLWKCFASVEELWLQQCNNLVHWLIEEFQSLVRLSFLHISLCTNLEGRGSSSEETLPLPHLEKLHICRCRSLLELPKLPASLEELKISQCKNLVALPSNLGDLTKLTVLYVDRCYDLKALPDGMNHLASLEWLQIQGPGGEKFQLGPVQWPPAIRSLIITGCPELQRRCREGGEYFHLVSSIAIKCIQAPEFQHGETESSMKKFLKRLFPACADRGLKL